MSVVNLDPIMLKSANFMLESGWVEHHRRLLIGDLCPLHPVRICRGREVHFDYSPGIKSRDMHTTCACTI